MKYGNRLDLWGSVPYKNDIGSTSHRFEKIKTVYCQIKPQHGGLTGVAGTDVEEAHTMQRVFIRKLSIKEPKIDMYFQDNQGNKYEVLDYFPNYKDNSEWEFRTKITYV